MASDRIKRQIERLLDQVEEAVDQSDWQLVRQIADNILILDPTHVDAQSYLISAERALGPRQPEVPKESFPEPGHEVPDTFSTPVENPSPTPGYLPREELIEPPPRPPQPPAPPRQPAGSGAGSGRTGGMPSWLLFGGLGVIVMAVIAIVIAMSAGGGGDIRETVAVEVTREVPVTNVVTREVPVTKIVTQEVPTRRPTPVNPWCFVTGTPVLTSTGYIAIEELQKGDTVLSYDHNFQRRVEANIPPLVEANIAAVVSRQVNGLMRVELADGTTIRVTSEHPFYSPDEARYKPIGEFKPGERLGRIGRNEKLETIVVTGIKAVRGEFTVYNLSVEGSHHNYVAAGVLVHNKTLVPPTYNPASYYNKGEEYLDAENWDMAIGEFTKAIQLDPDDADAYYSRGYSYSKLGQYQNAINDYTKTIQLDPDYARAYNSRGISYRNLDQYQNAINDYTKAIQLDPDFALVYNNRGISYANLGQYATAIADYTKAIQVDPNYARAYNNRGVSYANLGQYQNAINDFTKTIQLDPDAMVYNNRGVSYANLGQTANADADKARACSLDSQYC